MLRKLMLKDRFQHNIKMIQRFSTEFCTASSIHGLRYLTEKKRHWSERFWWLIAFSLSVWLCASSISIIWSKWCENPVSLSFTQKDLTISAVSFPEITICPETKTNSNKMDLISIFRDYKLTADINLTDAQLTQLQALTHICESLKIVYKFDDYFTGEGIYDVITQIASNLSSIFTKCSWQGVNTPCDELFAPILTEKGLCFTFNSINSREIYTEEMAPGMKTVNHDKTVSHWNFDHGYGNGIHPTEYPVRTFNSDYQTGLNVIIRLFKADLEYICHQRGLGFNIILSVPGETLINSKNSFRVSLLEDTRISMKPKLITTSEGLRHYSPNQRQCFYTDERKLQFFKMYTQSNCEAECLANFTKQECGCVKFSMPRDKSTKICGAAKISCYEAADCKLFQEDIVNSMNDSALRSFRTECNCLPSCSSIDYTTNADVDRIKYDLEILEKTLGMKNLQMRMSRLSIFYQDHEVETLKRVEAYTLTDFIAICGGLFGLFLGISVLSLVEFIYFATLRLYWTIRYKKLDNTVTPFDQTTVNTFFIGKIGE